MPRTTDRVNGRLLNTCACLLLAWLSTALFKHIAHDFAAVLHYAAPPKLPTITLDSFTIPST
jgi:hypothetical protein